MGVRILANEDADMACLYCSTTNWAFGPLFESTIEAERFLKYLEREGVKDPRQLKDWTLEEHFHDFCAIERKCYHDEGLCLKIDLCENCE